MINTDNLQLFDSTSRAIDNTIYHLPTNAILTNPHQPRKHFEPSALVDLASSIRQYGLMQPITVRQVGDSYQLVAGERRLRASILAEFNTIPAIVVDIDDTESAVLAMLENLQRQELNYVEEAEGYSILITKHGLTQEELAQKLSKSQSAIANKLRILRLSDDVKEGLIKNGLSERHARALLKLEKVAINKDELDSLQLKIVGEIIKHNLTVSKTEKLIENIINGLGNKKAKESNIKMYIRDMRIFTNTIKDAVDTMVSSGLNATYELKEHDDGCYISIMVVY